MGWYGPQGDCGCCAGPCDAIGLVTDVFTAVNPKWQFVIPVNSGADIFIDTAKPGLYLFRENSTSGSVSSAVRCQNAPSSLVGLTVRFKSKILVDFSTDFTAESYLISKNIGVGESGDIAQNIARIFAFTVSGSLAEYRCTGIGVPFATTGVLPQDGDIVEISVEFLTSSTASTTYTVNSTVIASGTGIYSPLDYQGLFNFSYWMPSTSTEFIEMWVQDFESEVIPP